MEPNLLELLKTNFGYDSFRLTQQKIIENTLQKKDSLVIMPTGGGKSICYQLPALARSGMALVVSPLIALMKDQVEALKINGIEAGAFYSAQTAKEAADVKQKVKQGVLKILYISPEKAVTDNFISFIRPIPLNLLAIDEAHCVSIWGNDFRPEYTQLPKLLNEFPDVPYLALTATADKATQGDIITQLRLRNPLVAVSSFERKNLFIKVLPAHARMDSIYRLLEQKKEENGIIYCLSRKSTEELAQRLQQKGYKAASYHAGMDADTRHRVQEDFQKDKINIICATIAFGMGIDKPNIRFIIHYNLPKNIESYYQEIGRAGRDGEAASTVLFFNYHDAQILRSFIDGSEASDQFKQVQHAKLSRLMDYCQATSCRTNMILNYFGEYRSETCGHCDNCKHPPEKFNGTKIAQMTLSACKRLKENVAMGMLTDVLRGAQRHEIFQFGYNNIKTYGIGKDISREHWMDYISQMINLGLLEVDFTQSNKLKVTGLGNNVLFKDDQVYLSKPREWNKAVYEKPKSKTQVFEEELMELLKSTRLKVANEENVPAFVIFSDATLREMVEEKPLYASDFLQINGVGDHKMDKYGDTFMKVIQDYVNKSSPLKSIKGKTYLETMSLLNEGLSPNEIAEKRQLNPLTVYSHIAYLYEKDNGVDLFKYISQNEIDEIHSKWLELNQTDQLKPIFEALNEKHEYYKIRLALAFLQKNYS